MVSVLTYRPKSSKVTSECTDTFKFELFDKAFLTHFCFFTIWCFVSVLSENQVFAMFVPFHLSSTIMNNKQIYVTSAPEIKI